MKKLLTNGELTEHRLSKTLFKLAAEMAFTMNILAGAFKLDPDKVEIMKEQSFARS